VRGAEPLAGEAADRLNGLDGIAGCSGSKPVTGLNGGVKGEQ